MTVDIYAHVASNQPSYGLVWGWGGVVLFPAFPVFFFLTFHNRVLLSTETEEQKKQGRPGNEARGGDVTMQVHYRKALSCTTYNFIV